MESGFQAPRGTYDLLPAQALVRRAIVESAGELLESAGFGQIDTPAFEDTDLFARTVGEATDIVSKEMYTFSDRSDRSLTLRPEGSAPVCRAYIEHGMHKLPQPVRLWYSGPMFRYEAPQSGRFRQHTQIGAEVLGSDDPAVDAEMIDLLGHMLSRLGITQARLHLNSVGDAATRGEYTAELRSYLLASDVFDERQRVRIETNPMRAFDWDGDEIVALTESAPKMVDRLSEADRQHFEQVRSLLDGAGIDYLLDPRLVRGLDYYTRTVFEYRSERLGAQSGIGGGGRYDGLVEQIGGKHTPAMGWGSGVERIAQVLANSDLDEQLGRAAERGPDFIFAVTEPAARQRVFRAVSELREDGVRVAIDHGGRSLKGQLKQASKAGIGWVVIIGEQEWRDESATLRNMDQSSQEQIPLNRLREELVERAAGEAVK